MLAVPAVYAVLRHVPESRDPSTEGTRLDLPGAVLGAAALAPITYALVAFGEDEVDRPALLVGLVLLGVAAAAAFVVVERRSDHPMLPLDIFSSGQFTHANVLTLPVYAALGGIGFLLVVQLQTSLGYSALEAGVALLPGTLLLGIFSGRAGELAQRVGPRRLVAAGPLLVSSAGSSGCRSSRRGTRTGPGCCRGRCCSAPG